MRQINVRTLEMEEYFGDDIPDYAILSHTWGHEEVSYREWVTLTQFRKLEPSQLSELEGTMLKLLNILPIEDIQKNSGYSKIVSCCQQAKSEGLAYAWVDTCCIDKTSSAELSEAINSMFEWYRLSSICFAYLADVTVATGNDNGFEIIRSSRWFTRGWTLQEFLAPQRLAFYDSEWIFISFKGGHLLDLLSSITGIDTTYVDGVVGIETASIAQRMSWASKRNTTRIEDMAYCLLGYFYVNMPLLYGEGAKAFERLQEEIVRQSEDHTYLAAGFQLPLNRGPDRLFR